MSTFQARDREVDSIVHVNRNRTAVAERFKDLREMVETRVVVRVGFADESDELISKVRRNSNASRRALNLIGMLRWSSVQAILISQKLIQQAINGIESGILINPIALNVRYLDESIKRVQRLAFCNHHSVVQGSCQVMLLPAIVLSSCELVGDC